MDASTQKLVGDVIYLPTWLHPYLARSLKEEGLIDRDLVWLGSMEYNIQQGQVQAVNVARWVLDKNPNCDHNQFGLTWGKLKDGYLQKRGNPCAQKHPYLMHRTTKSFSNASNDPAIFYSLHWNVLPGYVRGKDIDTFLPATVSRCMCTFKTKSRECSCA